MFISIILSVVLMLKFFIFVRYRLSWNGSYIISWKIVYKSILNIRNRHKLKLIKSGNNYITLRNSMIKDLNSCKTWEDRNSVGDAINALDYVYKLEKI